MKIFNTTTKKIENICLTNEYEYDQTQQIMENCSDFKDYAKYNEETDMYEMNDDNIQWWKKLEEKNVIFANILEQKSITVSQFQEWCEKKGYEISTDIEASYTDCLVFLKDMIKENNSVEKKKQNISYYHER